MENDQFPNRDRPGGVTTRKSATAHGPCFLTGSIHQKLSGRSSLAQNNATRFYRHRRGADPSWFFESTSKAAVSASALSLQ
jgi:hypothetical protein